MKTIHPFPARMAPEIALDALETLPPNSIILDPMAGSGTVLRQAVVGGHDVFGFDLDPLAVLLTTAWTVQIDFDILDDLKEWLLSKAKKITLKEVALPWQDKETKAFISFWFGKKQQHHLSKIAHVLHNSRKLKRFQNELAVLKVVLSRIIITKKRGASLAWDISHSRPHKVIDENDYDVWDGFQKAYTHVTRVLKEAPIKGEACIKLGDARSMETLETESIDAVVTSPPYLNAIDYLRGHRLALVWLGHSVSAIRNIRGCSIGVEKRVDINTCTQTAAKIIKSLRISSGMRERQVKMLERYAYDAFLLMKEIERVLKYNGKAVLVVGDSCVNNVFVRNSKIFYEAAQHAGLTVACKPKIRELPIGSRYLPMPKDPQNALNKRMKNEVIMEFKKNRRPLFKKVRLMSF